MCTMRGDLYDFKERAHPVLNLMRVDFCATRTIHELFISNFKLERERVDYNPFHQFQTTVIKELLHDACIYEVT